MRIDDYFMTLSYCFFCFCFVLAYLLSCHQMCFLVLAIGKDLYKTFFDKISLLDSCVFNFVFCVSVLFITFCGCVCVRVCVFFFECCNIIALYALYHQWVVPIVSLTHELFCLKFLRVLYWSFCLSFFVKCILVTTTMFNVHVAGWLS